MTSKKLKKPKALARPPWRPSSYSTAKAEEICRRMSAGESLLQICKTKGMPNHALVLYWIQFDKHPEFTIAYKRASDARSDLIFDSLDEIAHDKTIDTHRARLIIDTRKWYLTKVMPRKYGDKIDITSGGQRVTPILGNVLQNISLRKNSKVIEADQSDPGGDVGKQDCVNPASFTGFLGIGQNADAD